MEPYYMPNGTDFAGLFQMVCPDCGQQVRVQGNAMSIWIVSHEVARGRPCTSANRDLLPESRRPRR